MECYLTNASTSVRVEVNLTYDKKKKNFNFLTEKLLRQAITWNLIPNSLHKKKEKKRKT